MAKGIAMCKSIFAKDEYACIFYLCLDIESYNFIMDIENFNVLPIHIDDLEAEDLDKLKMGNKSNYGTSYSQYCWALTPYFIWHLLNNETFWGKPNSASEILYCDADLYFYESPQLIFDACKNKSVGIHTHGFGSYDPETNDVGEFNVGCVYFRNDETGKKIALWWKDCMLNLENEYAAKYGTCGDQKYLDLFIPLFGDHNIAVFDRDTNPKIKHGAPWNFGNYDFNAKQELLFNHFSHFKTDFNGNWSSSDHGEWAPENIHPKVNEYYVNYNQKVTEENQLINK